MKRTIVLLLIMMGFVAPHATTSAQEVVVGTLFDHSGALQDWGPRHQNAAELAAKQLAAAGLTVNFVHQDSQTNADAAKQAAEKLIAEDQVAAIIGSSSSGVIVPVAEAVTSPKNMLLISPGATSPYITDLPQDKDKDLLFRTCPSDTLQGVVLGKLAASLYKTASVVYVNNPYGQGLARHFQRSFVRHGGFVYTMIPHGEEVAPSYVEPLRNAFGRMFATKPYRSGQSDVLCVISYPEHAKVFVEEAIEVYKCKHFLFTDGTKSEELAATVGAEKLEGMLGTAPGVAVGEAFLKFDADYTAEFGEFPKSPFIANAYDAAAVIGLAAYAAKAQGLPLTASNIRDQLRSVANPPGTFIGPGEFELAFNLLASGKPINYEGASGTIDFDQNGDVVAPIEVWRFKAGKIVTYRMEYQVAEE
ncbi:MAG: ABC transporter substrate-binding protein [Desulfobacterales bacterium]|jgi:ABC-type branched-subunit amino acid transport system substrate-binding protein